MLCERCQSREAAVHFSAVAWPSGDVTKHFCETCYPKAEAERTASYSPKAKPLPVLDVERITAAEYLSFAASAQANSADAPAYRHISNELQRFPAARERLALEILTMACEALDKGDAAGPLAWLGSCFGNSVLPPRSPAYIELLERFARRSVELMAQSPNAPRQHPLGLSLALVAVALHRADKGRFSALLEDLKAHRPPMPKIIDYFERMIAESGQRRRDKRDRSE